MLMSPEETPTPASEPELRVEGLNRRSSERIPCNWRITVRFFTRPELQSHYAIIKDISRQGMALIVDRQFDPGTVLAIELRRVQRGYSCVLSGEVRHATPTENGSWQLGCSLSRQLTDNEVDALK